MSGSISEKKQKHTTTKLLVNPGVCGFECSIIAYKKSRRAIDIDISSECVNIQNLASRLQDIDLRGVLAQINKNPIFKAASEAKCHSSCPIPVAIIKAAEVCLQIALPKNIKLEFEDD